jgi:DNA-binding Lrp family transcriptional regulator
MDGTDKKLLDLIKGNARMSYQEIGDALGMSRVAAKKRVDKLEKAGIIRGYNTYIKRDDEITMLIDIMTTPEGFEKVLRYVAMRTAFVRQIFTTHKENHIHMVAVSDSPQNLKYLVKMINKEGGDGITEMHVRQVQEVIKDVYGGIKYEPGSESNTNTDN